MVFCIFVETTRPTFSLRRDAAASVVVSVVAGVVFTVSAMD